MSVRVSVWTCVVVFACPLHGSFIKDTPEDAAERFLREFAAKRKWSKPATGDDSEIDSAEDDEAVEKGG